MSFSATIPAVAPVPCAAANSIGRECSSDFRPARRCRDGPPRTGTRLGGRLLLLDIGGGSVETALGRDAGAREGRFVRWPSMVLTGSGECAENGIRSLDELMLSPCGAVAN
ncbi:hypothetical protein ACVDFE_30585 [Lentzea chajnantorensis]